MSPTKQRTILMYTIGTIFLIGVVWILLSFATSVGLTLVSDDASVQYIVHENSPTPRNIDVPHGGTQAYLRVEPGNYTVIAKNAATSTSQVVDVRAGENKTVTLKMDSAKAVIMNMQPVTSMGTTSISATSDHITFIDSNNDNSPLYTVDLTNHVRLVDGSRTYMAIRWADPNYGIGEYSAGSTNYGLVRIDNLVVSNIALPFTAAKPISFAVAPDHTLYVADDHTVYRANGDGSFTKVYTSNNRVDISTASNSAILIAEKDPKKPREGNLISLHTDGTKYEIDGEAYESAWSPSGKKLVTSGDTSEIFDNQLNKVRALPQGNFSSPVWLNDDTLLYTFGSKVWKYSLQTGRAAVIVSMDSSVGAFAMIRPDSTQDFLYTSIFRSGFGKYTYTLSRVNLSNKTTPDPDIARSLSLVLPYAGNLCRIDYVNFTALSVVVKPLASSTDCVAVAKNEIVAAKALRASTAAALNFQQLP